MKGYFFKKLCIYGSIFTLFVFLNQTELSASSPDTNWKALNQRYQNLIDKRPLPTSQLLKLIQEFEHFYKNYPTHNKAPYTLFRTGQLYRRLFQNTKKSTYINRSLRKFRQLITTFPTSTLVDDSQFLIGNIFEKDKEELPIALLEYNKVLTLFDGDQKQRALDKIQHLQNQHIPVLTNSLKAEPLPALPAIQQGGLSIDQSRHHPKAIIRSIQFWQTSQWLRIVIQTNRPIPYIYSQLSKKKSEGNQGVRQFHMDLLDSQPAPSLQQSITLELENNTIVQNLFLKPTNPRITKLTFNLLPYYEVLVYDYESIEGNNIALEIFTKKPLSSPINTWLPGPKKPNKNQNFQSRPRRIIIDPGHGGRDPGAEGYGIYEKDIVLAIAKELKNRLEKQASLQVFLTRDSDRFVSLLERSVLAKKWDGDFFISLHVNAHSLKSVSGVESYYLDTTANPATMRLATRENQMSNQGAQNFSLILRDLLNQAQTPKSVKLTQTIHHHLVKAVQTRYHVFPRDLGVKQAPFLLLHLVGMPSTLLELSFITNFEENQRLQDPEFHRAIAEGIAQGIQSFLK